MNENNNMECMISYKGISTKFWSSLLLAIFSSIITLLSTNSNSNSSMVFLLFIGVLVVFYSILVNDKWGIFTAFLSSLLFCLTVNLSFKTLAINVIANTVQAFLLWFMLKCNRIKHIFDEENIAITNYNCLLFSLGILYLILSTLFKNIQVVVAFVVTIIVITAIKSIVKRERIYIIFNLNMFIT